jgi:hypothetical protein
MAVAFSLPFLESRQCHVLGISSARARRNGICARRRGASIWKPSVGRVEQESQAARWSSYKAEGFHLQHGARQRPRKVSQADRSS